MVRAIALCVALMLTGTSGTLACLSSCGSQSVPAAAAAECHERASAPAERGVNAAPEACDAPLVAMSFLVETSPWSLSVSTAQPAVATSAIHQAAEVLTDRHALSQGHFGGPPLAQLHVTILRI